MMKKIFNLTVAAIASVLFFSCDPADKGGDDNQTYAEPSMEWAANPNFDPMPITEDMDVNITVNAEAGIAGFIVKVESESEEFMAAITVINNGSDELDLIGNTELADALAALTEGKLPTGDALLGKTKVDFQLSSLVPLISAFTPADGSQHVFTLTVTDKAGQTFSKACTFVYNAPAGSASISISDIDLWKNTAVVTVEGADASAYTVSYRKKGTETWFNATAGDNGFNIAPEYEESTNEGQLKVYTVKEGTGIYAKSTYEVQLMKGSEVAATTEFTTEGGDVIPNGDMSGWSELGTGKNTYPFPNASDSDNPIWTSGNNTISKALCIKVTDEATGNIYAELKPYTLSFLKIFACGNLYVGEFTQSGTKGDASFGYQYAWSARPKALKVKYRAQIGNIDFVGKYDPDQTLKGKGDKSRIYATVIDWTKRHIVTSGNTVDPTSTMWDPESAASVEEGEIIGYASHYITESTAGEEFVELVIPFHWYDTEAKPAAENFSLVISCATSYRGDYLTGCSTNKLWVDDFEWVY